MAVNPSGISIFAKKLQQSTCSGALRICVQYGGRLWSETASERGLQCLNMLIKRLKCSYICSASYKAKAHCDGRLGLDR